MRRDRRTAADVARSGFRVAAALGLLAVVVPAIAHAGTSARGSKYVVNKIGKVAYVSRGGQVDVATVDLSGNTSRPKQIGPVTTRTRHRLVRVSGFVGSGDGRWIAWQEIVTRTKHRPATTRSYLILRAIRSGDVYRLRTASTPVGFAGDQLVVYGSHTSVVDLKPSPHLTEVAGGDGAPLAAYPGGTVTVQQVAATSDSPAVDRLGLTTFDGTTTVLHDYPVEAGSNAVPDRGYVSSDNTELAVEVGDPHALQGRSGVIDTYDLTGTGTRTTIGHVGSAARGWRLGDATFVSSTNQIWVAWRRQAGRSVDSVVAYYDGTGWRRVVTDCVVVEGNQAGDVIVQPGNEVKRAGRIDPVPVSNALLLRDKVTRVLGVGGSAFAWIV